MGGGGGEVEKFLMSAFGYTQVGLIYLTVYDFIGAKRTQTDNKTDYTVDLYLLIYLYHVIYYVFFLIYSLDYCDLM